MRSWRIISQEEQDYKTVYRGMIGAYATWMRFEAVKDGGIVTVWSPDEKQMGVSVCRYRTDSIDAALDAYAGNDDLKPDWKDNPMAVLDA